MNPAGWIFGRTAALNVGGSFHATTADYIKLGTDGVFFADAAKASTLTSSPPSAFGFLTSNPAAIDAQTGTGSFATRLQVPNGNTISLVGGPVSVGAPSGQPAAGFILAQGLNGQGGVVNLASVASPGEATLGTAINVDSFAKLGNIQLKGGALIDAREINIRAGQLQITDATLFPGLLFSARLAGAVAPAGGQVNIKVSDALTITGAESSVALALPGITTFNGASFSATPVAGDAPGINIEAGSFSMSGRAGIVANRFGPGNGSTVVLKANTIEVRNGSSIALSNSFGGGAFPTAGGSLTISGNNMTLASDGNSLRTTAIGSTGNFHPAYGQGPAFFSPFFQFADSAPVIINLTGNLVVLDNARITTDSFAFGRSGPININAANMSLIGSGAETARIAAQSGLVGESGTIRLMATGNIDIQNGFQITANTFGSGNGGIVDVTAGQSITLTGTNSRILSGTLQAPDDQYNTFAQKFAGIFGVAANTFTYAALRSRLVIAPAVGDLMQVLARLNAMTSGGNRLVAATDFTPGDAGRLSLSAKSLIMNADTRAETSTGWNGNAGAILGNFGSLFVNDGAAMRSTSGITLLTGGISVGSGNAGSVTITATDPNTISITGRSPTSGAGSSISTTTLGAGKGGDITLNSAGKVQLSSGGQVTSSTTGAGAGGTVGVSASDLVSLSGSGTGLFSTASNSGAGGEINVLAPHIQIVDGATLSANSSGPADAGSVKVVTSDLNMQNGNITTEAALALGGNITITTTGSLVQLTDSEITTSVHGGGGKGGDIGINSDLVILDDSRILANAFGGPGGNINITADVFLVNSGGTLPTSLAGIVDASSALSTPGTINIEAAFTDVSGEVAQLPEAPLQATELLRASCAARFAGGKASSLVLGGRDGVPIQPGGLLPSPLYLATDSGNPVTGTKTTANNLPARFSLLGSADSKNRLLTRYSLLPNAKCAF